MQAQTPYDQIKFINDAIKDRQSKKEPTYFSVKVEYMGKQTPLVNKEEGSTFYETVIQYLTRYDLSALIIELYSSKSIRTKTPFQTIKVQVKKDSSLTLGNPSEKAELEFTNPESLVSTEKHFYTLAEKEKQVWMLEFENKRLQYELEILRKKNKKKKQYIQELESELEKGEKAKKNSFANVSLGTVTSNAIESFAKSDFGLGILKNVFGAKQEVLNGLLGIDPSKETEAETRETKEETKSTASIISEDSPKQEVTKEQKIRLQVIKHINDFLLASDDAVLRLYFEIVQLAGNNVPVLQEIYIQLKKQADTKKTKIKPNKVETNNNSEDSEKEETDLDDSS